MNEREDLVDIKEIMPLLGQKKVVSAWGFIHRNGVPYYSLGKRKKMFSRAAVLAWRDARIVGNVTLGSRAAPAVRAALSGSLLAELPLPSRKIGGC